MVQQIYRLLASDVVWADLFQAPSVGRPRPGGRASGHVPSSHFLAVPDALITIKAMTLILDRITNSGSTSTGGDFGLHGTNILADRRAAERHGRHLADPDRRVNAQRGHDQLEPRVPGHDLQRRHLAGGADPGDADDRPPRLAGRPDHEEREGAAGRPGPVRLGHVQRPRPGAVRVSDQGSVDVAPVPGETNTTNNSAVYNVIFSLPS